MSEIENNYRDSPEYFKQYDGGYFSNHKFEMAKNKKKNIATSVSIVYLCLFRKLNRNLAAYLF